MRTVKIMTISMPKQMAEDISKRAKKESRTISELLREAYRQYSAISEFEKTAKKARALVKRKGLLKKDLLGNDFEG